MSLVVVAGGGWFVLSLWECWAVQLCPLWFVSRRPVLASKDPGAQRWRRWWDCSGDELGPYTTQCHRPDSCSGADSTALAPSVRLLGEVPEGPRTPRPPVSGKVDQCGWWAVGGSCDGLRGAGVRPREAMVGDEVWSHPTLGGQWDFGVLG